MNQPSPPTRPPEHPRPWLEKYYQARRQRTVDLVKATVDRLLKEGKTVTLEAICMLSREMDPAGKGIKKAGVLGNAEAHAYYKQHSASYQSRAGRGRKKPDGQIAVPPSRISTSRDVGRARQRYMKQSKSYLVERLLTVEQVQAQTSEKLAQLQFELLALQEQLEETRQRVKSKDRKHSEKDGP